MKQEQKHARQVPYLESQGARDSSSTVRIEHFRCGEAAAERLAAVSLCLSIIIPAIKHSPYCRIRRENLKVTKSLGNSQAAKWFTEGKILKGIDYASTSRKSHDRP